MKIILDGLSIIVVGGWNSQIFSPAWLQKNVCDDEKCQVELAIPISQPATLPRMSFEGVHLFVDSSRLELRPQTHEVESFVKCSNFLKKILTVLNHTPIISFGVNFTFVSHDNDYEEIIPKFTLTDIALFDAEKNKLKQIVIQRAFQQSDDSILNLSITLKDERAIVSFNYHRDVDNVDACVEELTDDFIPTYYDKSVAILNEVYGVQVDQDLE